MQSDTYQEKLDRKRTEENIIDAMKAAAKRCEAEVLRKQLWYSIRKKDFTRSVRYFMWMLIYDAYNVGNHWKHIPGCETRATCQTCGTEENMGHILTQCSAPGQEDIWRLADQMWRGKTGNELQISKGTIMSCGIQPPETHKTAAARGKERL